MEAGDSDEVLMRQSSIGLFYVVAAALGVAFLAALLMLAWGSALQSANREFALESLSLDESANSKFRITDDAIHFLANTLATSRHDSASLFAAMAHDLRARHEFLVNVAWYQATPDNPERLLLVDTAAPQRDPFPAEMQLDEAGGAATDVPAVLATTAALPVMLPRATLAAGEAVYYLAHRVAASDASERARGVVIFALDPAAVLGPLAVDERLSVQLFSESEGLGGRNLIMQKSFARATAGLVLKTLSGESHASFDRYSMRLVAEKRLLWRDLDKALLSAAAILGSGVTLLLIALARAKDLQTRELAARNLVIEEQVRRQTRELAEARDQALEASRVKSDFLASMSHEIRTPLNAIIGMAELLAETDLARDQAKYVDVFKNAGEALSSLVNDILDLSKIEAGQLELESIDYALPELINQAVQIYALRCAEKGITLGAEIAADVPTWVRGDPNRLRQIVLNLLGNAMKFTERGEIGLRVDLVTRAAGEHSIRIAVCDTGIGIPAQKLATIFDSFTQVDSTTTRKYGGTGLGLSISKRLVELMGGDISVTSEPGHGSRFVFEFPLERGQPPTVATSAAEGGASPTTSPQRKRILLVEDNPDNRLLIKTYLKRAPIEVDEAQDGAAAVAKFRSGAYDLILMDVQMPVMDGHEATRTIRALEAATAGKTTPIIALTAHALKEEMAKSLAAGCSAHLTKPIKKQTLLEALQQYGVG